MKKILALTLALVLCLSLCACNKEKETVANEINETETIEVTNPKPSEYAGVWITSTAALHLYEDGVALSVKDSDGNVTTSSLDTYGAIGKAGTWDIRDGHIIFYFVDSRGSTFDAYKITDDTLIDYESNVYTR